MYANGIYIQDLSVDMRDSFIVGTVEALSSFNIEYYGVARYLDFPLSKCNDNISQQISNKMYVDEHHSIYRGCKGLDIVPLLVITSKDYYQEYLNRCNELRIQTRAFFIESTRGFPLWNEELPDLKTIGYEVINPNMCDSSFCELLNTRRYKHFVEKLNGYGLFEDFETAELFLTELYKYDKEELEENDGLIAKISLLDDMIYL